MKRFDLSQTHKLAAMDDPVPSFYDPTHHEQETAPPHSIECEVLRRLKHSPGMKFQELSVHRLPDGVCLMGVVKVDAQAGDICEIARLVNGVDRVVNRLVVH
jgi:osmotically-inducible protein OsmY